MTTNPIRVYDFTLKEENITVNDIKTEFNKICKEYCFQLEEGENSGYRHYQGRIHLRNKTRFCQFKKYQPFSNQCSWSITSAGAVNNNDYVTKSDTRIEGPWTHKDEPPPYIPKQVRNIVLRGWQQTLLETADVWTPRIINVLIDYYGNIGKSTVATYMRCHGKARIIPPCNDAKDIMRMVCDMPTAKCYVFDLPRAANKTNLGGMYSAIETIASGYAYDDRYKFREKLFDSPVIWVFTNIVPNLSLLSDDRWKLWEVKNGVLSEIARCDSSDDE